MKKYKYNIEDYKFYCFSSCNYLTSFYATCEYNPPAGSNLNWFKFHHALHDGNYDLPGLEFPVIFKQDSDSGKKFPDILDFRDIIAYLFSDRFVEALKAEGITGWKTYPIQIFDKKGNEIKGYNGISITGSCGDLGFQEFDANGDPLPASWGFDLNTWDGSDMFQAKNRSGYYVTNKVIKMLVKYKLGSCEYYPLPYEELPYEERRRWERLIR